MGWAVSLKVRMSGWKDQIARWFIDREFFMRTNGQVRFLRVSAQFQRDSAVILTSVIGVWLLVTFGMAINQMTVTAQLLALTEQEAKVESAEKRVASYRGSIDEVTKDLERRQQILESLGDQYLSDLPQDEAQAPAASSDSREEEKAVKTISAMVPEAAGLARIEVRQIRFAEKMAEMAQARKVKAEAAIHQCGLNPEVLARQARNAQGGLFEPFFGKGKKDVRDPRFVDLAAALGRMDAMERALAAIPTASMMMSSGFGYRSDPFTGSGAMHSGLDFKGPVGTPILAAAKGKVVLAGFNGGYVEIRHANGLVTRYAHLSGLNVRRG
jgi:murein DD-endopeptidase MepM/ murein hydrolase activator NlpD